MFKSEEKIKYLEKLLDKSTQEVLMAAFFLNLFLTTILIYGFNFYNEYITKNNSILLYLIQYLLLISPFVLTKILVYLIVGKNNKKAEDKYYEELIKNKGAFFYYISFFISFLNLIFTVSYIISNHYINMGTVVVIIFYFIFCVTVVKEVFNDEFNGDLKRELRKNGINKNILLYTIENDSFKVIGNGLINGFKILIQAKILKDFESIYIKKDFGYIELKKENFKSSDILEKLDFFEYFVENKSIKEVYRKLNDNNFVTNLIDSSKVDGTLFFKNKKEVDILKGSPEEINKNLNGFIVLNKNIPIAIFKEIKGDTIFFKPLYEVIEK